MNTIEEAKLEKNKLQTEIAKLIIQFEDKYGQDTIKTLYIKRWNGSNNAFGKVSEICANIALI